MRHASGLAIVAFSFSVLFWKRKAAVPGGGGVCHRVRRGDGIVMPSRPKKTRVSYQARMLLSPGVLNKAAGQVPHT